jgi:2-keto-4-pentenoate hydratase
MSTAFSPQQTAACLLPAWQSHGCVNVLPEPLRPADRAQAYQAQWALWDACGEPGIGWKIAATSQAGQQHIGVSGPLAGRLLASRCHSPGSVISLQGNRMRVIEAEFAFRLGRDVTGTAAQPLAVQEVMSAVADLHLAIEIPNSRYANFVTAGEGALIADFACACHVVLGEAVQQPWRSLDLAVHQVSALVNGVTVAQGQGANVLGDPRWALTWLANELIGQGRCLKAGDTVITGTCVVPVPVQEGDAVTVDFGNLGTLCVALSD